MFDSYKMKNLGEKLRTAREKLGVSVRDAADTTRLRANVIENMESGEFSFDLPEVYKRGFLRIYAGFLKLDVPAVMEEFTRASQIDEPEKKNILSRFPHQKSVFAPVPDGEGEVSTEKRYNKSSDTFPDGAPAPVDGGEKPSNSASFVKLGAVFVGVILLVVIIVMTVSSIMKKRAPELNPDVATPAQSSAVVPVAPETAPQAQTGTLVISASGDTFIVVFLENNQQRPLYSGPIQAGDKKTFEFDSPLIVKATDAEKLVVEKNGNKLDLKGKKGLSKFRISPVSK